MDFAAIRSRLAGSDGRLYWRSLGQLADTPEFREYLHREFPEQASEWNDPKGRRHFLKLMSASLALAGVGACTRQPSELIVPYVRQPEDIVPGRPLYFASAITISGTAMPVLVESHMGRPTKIEGNPEHPASRGGTDIFTQAAVLDLYDPDRAQTIMFRGSVRAWSVFVTEMHQALSAQRLRGGAGLHLLTPPITSPSLAEMVASVQRDYPNARWHQYDPIARPTALSPARARSSTVYHFDKADVVVALDADFLACGPGSVRYSKDFASRRRVTDDNKAMNRLYAIESTPSLTGAKADHRLALRAGEIEGFAAGLAAAVGAGGGTPSRTPSADETKWIAAIAKDLQAHKGSAVVVAGDFQPDAVHAAARAINDALGNSGTTVTYGANIEAAPLTSSSIAELAQAMDAGQVELLVIMGGNPAFTAPVDLRFAERMTKVPLSVYYADFADETTPHCHWHIPAAHALESWGDYRSFDGTVTLSQPLIAPLYDGHSPHEFLSVFTGQTDKQGQAAVKDFWTKVYSTGQGGWTFKHPRDEAFANADAVWRTALHEGFIRRHRGHRGWSGDPAPDRHRSRRGSRGGRTGDAGGRRGTAADQHRSGRTRDEPAGSRSRRTGAARPGRDAAAGRRTRDHLPARSHRLGRPLREQRLAAGAAEAVHEADLGHDRVGCQEPGRRARPA